MWLLSHACAVAQVTLDSAAVLQQRYKQYNQLLVSLGLQHSKLAACVQPANKVSSAAVRYDQQQGSTRRQIAECIHCSSFNSRRVTVLVNRKRG